ncbi:putative mitochondrial hypothetical protein [Leptomonas pyrrhocoris]|uniref:Uncharacterized protein n=1 Tax=Leptomonas pyrrhocoris TaxID=157538 RepID=A0A0M9FQ75_LEPPY|nr:putative mitochondrial hypothetical protein [Leptomonas pyrrhocoris]KPA73646.1 putative mitochondrial hypothetical protein [Leptomonas pyrrhocoris]|eukprot:XP_015652085.1 putative mitochondrial hypothetical protein [Leptomonas pyrrhocoris]
MSFRYTNNLVATLKHRLFLEVAHRQLVRQTFTGVCSGVEVTCSAYGTVVRIRMLDKAVWEPQYRLSDSSSEGPGAASSPDSTTTASAARKGIDLVRLSASIQAATWQAIHKLRAAKEAAHAQSLRHNPQLRAAANLRDWYEQDANTLHPRPCDGLKSLHATAWMQAVRYGVPQPARFLSARETPEHKNAAVMGAGEAPATMTALSERDCDPANIPIGAAHPLFTPGLVQLELDPAIDAAATTHEGDGSRVDAAYVLSEQRKEMRGNEEVFWERVELIRRSQLAAIPNGVKRNYADVAATLQDHTEEKVQLRFTQ